MAEKKLLMIVNPRAGRSKSRAPLYDAAADFSDCGFLLSICRTAATGDAARFAAERGGAFDAVVAVGGDGTLNEVLSGLLTLPEPPPLAYLPQGSTNDFAASLHIPTDPVRAAQAVARWEPRRLDAGDFCG
ncbi:MAG: acylglycerol kinase family protein, partial [Oscillibacter sp.]|nr:acylglycerol kinase family protein [Oscillibacter sp.]